MLIKGKPIILRTLFVSENIGLKLQHIISDKHKENSNSVKVVWLNVYCFCSYFFFFNHASWYLRRNIPVSIGGE